jgi:nitrogen regulatory protein PII
MSMIEIKAYIRRSKVDAVVQGLQSVGINTISIILF